MEYRNEYGYSRHISQLNHPRGQIRYLKFDDPTDDEKTDEETNFEYINNDQSSSCRLTSKDEKAVGTDTDSGSTFSNSFVNCNGSSDSLFSKLRNRLKLRKSINVFETEPNIQQDSKFECPTLTYLRSNVKVEEITHSELTKPIKLNDAVREEPQKGPRMDWDNYHRLGVIHTFMDGLESNYPSICTTGPIGKSLEGREIKILKISNSDTSNASVWIDAGIHAREWIGPAVATYIANHISTNFSDMPTSITNKDWYILPVANPDGYEYSHTVDRMWRKNRAWVRGECVGVDLNRNFSYGWGGKGSSNSPPNAFFRGPGPFSEPESAAMRDMLTTSGISFKVYITLHSYGQVIIFPFAFKEDLCPDYVRLLEGATVMSKAIFKASGNIYKVGISRDVMYNAAGTSNDFSYGAAGIPFCYLIELRSRKHKFKLPKEEIAETGNEILNCVKALMEFVDNYPCDESIKSDEE